jgi:transcriptional regulator with XRE-family HTH domain
MAHFGETIRRLREVRFHWSQAELAERIGSDRQHVSRIEAKSLATIRQETYRKLAQAFDMSVEQLDREWRGTKIPQTQGAPGLVPVINRAPAGIVVNYDESGVDSGQGRFYIERAGVSDPNAFAVVVIGDSMEGELTEGDYAIFSPMHMDGTLINMPAVKIEEGHTVFVRFSQDSRHEGCTLAMLYRLSDGRIELRKRNKKYKPIVVAPEEIAGMSALNQVRQNKIPGMMAEFEAFDPASKRNDDLE